jgi:hypothetical protein
MYNNFLPDSSSSSSSSSGSSSGSSFNWGGLISSGISGVTSYFGSVENKKAAEAQAEALKQKGYSDIEVAKLMLEGKKLELQTALAGGNKKSGGNTTLYIALGVGGVLVLGLVIFAVTRKKAQ